MTKDDVKILLACVGGAILYHLFLKLVGVIT
jgi:hypothetical protein